MHAKVRSEKSKGIRPLVRQTDRHIDERTRLYTNSVGG